MGQIIVFKERHDHIKKNGDLMIFRFFCAVLTAFSVAVVSLPVFATTYTFNTPNINVPTPIVFLNGGFEDPVNTNANYDANTKNYPNNANLSKAYVRMSYVPGWYTYPIVASNVGSYAWDAIELQNIVDVNPNATRTNRLPGALVGSQDAELNANYASRLNQTCATEPGTKIFWQFAHAARNQTGDRSSTTYYDAADFYLRPGGTNGATTPSASEIIMTAATNLQGGHTAQSVLNGAQATDGYNGKQWCMYRGTFTVPQGYTSTELGWQVVHAGSGSVLYGNYVDDIKMQTTSSLIVEKAIFNSSGNRVEGGFAAAGDELTVRVTITNWGETDAAPCVMTDRLWDGLSYVPGSGTVSGDTGVTGTVAESAGTVTAYVGEEAAASAGGTLEGSAAYGTSATTGKGEQAVVTYHVTVTGAPGSQICNQASVNYYDKNFESFDDAGGITSYSLVDYGIANAKNLGVSGQSGTYTMNMLNSDGSVRASYSNVDTNNDATYVNRFTVVDREVDGTVWMDDDKDGMIDTGERLDAGQTVKLQKLTNGIWSDAVDWQGNSLTTQTGTDGRYSFNGILPGSYRAMIQLPTGYRVVGAKSTSPPAEVTTAAGAQGSVDNDALTVGGWGVIMTLNKTTDAAEPRYACYYTHNADFGLCPGPTVVKNATVENSAAIQNGAPGSPVTVFYGDYLTYTVTVSNDSADSTGLTSTLNDTLPAGLTYISSSASAADVIGPTIDGQHLSWTIPVLLSGQSRSVTVTARVTTPGLEMDNTAILNEQDGGEIDSNTTYHDSVALSLQLTKKVTGTFADPKKNFVFTVSVGSGQGDLFSGLPSVYSYTGMTAQDGAAAPDGGTLTVGSPSTVILGNGQGIVISGLPRGTVFSVRETDYTADGYSTSCDFSSSTANAGTDNEAVYSAINREMTGTLNSNNEFLVFSNTKYTVPPTGIILQFWPYILLALGVIAAIVVIVVRHVRSKKKSDSGDDDKRDDSSGGL